MRQLRVSVLAAFALGFASAALAQSYPAKPIKIVVPFPPGNTMDIMTRLGGPKMTERIGQQIIVENRPGASGMLRLEFVARAAPDRYTIATGQAGKLTALPHTLTDMPSVPLKEVVPNARSKTKHLVIVAN